MRLRRTGAKKQPRYRVVIAEARSPRDGAFVDSIGYYDPLTEPATIRIDRDKALDWIRKGAQPSDTVVRLLRRSGIVEGEGAPRATTEAKLDSSTEAATDAKATPDPEAEAPAATEETVAGATDGSGSRSE
jgi:small subunit ribosomal protein S16